MSWKAADRYSQDYINLRTKDGVSFYKTPDSILRNQLEVWDKMIEAKSAENPQFKKALDSMRAFAERACRYGFDYNVDYRMAYNHYFGRPAAAPAKKS
jgi:TRAP-type mannitol/chloroaromatic compound transport system substrate-binding protein